MRLTFLGASETVTGSKFLLGTGDKRFLVDCGLFQGQPELRERNWQALPFDPAQLDALLLTHAHIDHSGYIPRLVREAAPRVQVLRAAAVGSTPTKPWGSRT